MGTKRASRYEPADCGLCGWRWSPRVERPSQCPRCHRYDWNGSFERLGARGENGGSSQAARHSETEEGRKAKRATRGSRSEVAAEKVEVAAPESEFQEAYVDTSEEFSQ